jgi:hypothetical protein
MLGIWRQIGWWLEDNELEGMWLEIEVALREVRSNWIVLVTTVGLLAERWARDYRNTKQGCYPVDSDIQFAGPVASGVSIGLPGSGTQKSETK